MTRTSADSHTVVSAVQGQLLIDGVWREADQAREMPVIDPATEQVLTYVADAGAHDGTLAVDAAVRAQVSWSLTSARERSEILYRAFELLTLRTEQFAYLMTLEMGKPLAEARGEVAYAAEFLRWFAEEAVRIDGGFSPRPDGTARTFVLKQPVGPCLLITPWNFPLAMGARKIGPAIAAGCTMVLKPAPQTPLSSLALAGLLMEAGLPPGVLNVVTTSQASEVVEPMFHGGKIRKLSFTGSTAVGKALLSQASHQVIRTSMELGGNAPFIVLKDADLNIAVESAFQAKMRNMGEACTAANRMYVHADIADDFASALADRMAALRVAPGLDEGSQVGPLIDEPSRTKVLNLVADARAQGARLLTGGDRPPGSGFFVNPTVLTQVPATAGLMSTEIFGPIAAIQTFTDTSDVIERANATEWGLVAYLMTRDVDLAFTVSERLDVGMVGLNTGLVSTPSAPFGGIKQSGLGREGGRIGIDEFLETKYIAMPIRPLIGDN